ncbi:16S rRNA (uracil(1498)-N(3))-methyltransferase [Brevibacillus sp. SYSU BS000544]|uniref:16S rRNA (uracil(1498)-N(3))-methyltransferase n=1 Tax=Brevibacillus sp. SYSU BS000544 TaxID=3416443 RepID=UPI003CE56FF5
MQRYFVEPHQMSDREVIITGDDVHHIVKVMRHSVGDSILVSNGEGRAALARLTLLNAGEVRADIVEERNEVRELPIRVTIGQGLPKADKLEWIIQKGTEMGAYAFQPFSSERTIVKLDEKKEGKKLERWQKIAKEAAEQAHRHILPKVLNPTSFKNLLASSESYSTRLIAYEQETSVRLKDVCETIAPGDSLLVLIGPEGGFSADEVALAQAAGFVSVQLGPRILRTETASQYVLAALSFHFE